MGAIRTSSRWFAAGIAAIVVSIFAFSGTAAAPPGAAPVHVVDADDASVAAQVTEDGSLQVSGEVSVGGTSSIEVSNFPSVQEVSGTVDIGNFPEAEVATEFRSVFLIDGDDDSASFAPIDARFISISSEDEVALFFTKPGGDAVIFVGTNRQPVQTISLPLAVTLDGVIMNCLQRGV